MQLTNSNPREEQQSKSGSETKLKKTKNTNKSIRHTRPTFKITKRNT